MAVRRKTAPQRDIFAAKIKEGQQQAILFEWAQWNVGNYPELRWLYASNQGIALGGAPNRQLRRIADPGRLAAEKAEIARTAAIRGAQMRRQGLKKGVADICLPVAKKGFSGLYIELKRSIHDKPTPEQLEFGAFVGGQGFLYVVCMGWESAAAQIAAYLGMGNSEQFRTA